MNRVVSWVLLAVGVAAAGGAWWWWRSSGRDAAAAPPRPPFVLPATLSVVERGTLDARATLTGTVRSVQSARIGFAIGGSVATIGVREGEVVAEGAPLAALDDRDQAARLAAANADTALARQELAALEAATRPEEIRRLEAQLATADADIRWARGEAERLRPLAEGKAVSVSSYDEMVAKRDAAEGRLAVARQALELARAGAREEDRAVARARVVTKEAATALAQREVDKTRLTSPFAGQVVRRFAAPGDALNAGQPVVEIVDLSRREVELEIPARFAAQMGKEARVEITVDERPGFSLPAKIDAHVLVADERSRSSRGIVRLGEGVDDEGSLRPGTFVRAVLHLDPIADRLLVPSDAVRLVQQGTIVVKALPPKQPSADASAAKPPAGPAMPPLWAAEWVPVRVVGAVGGRSAVEPAVAGQLSPGDHVVVVGVDRMFPGAPILPRDMAPAGAAAPAPGAGKPPPSGKTP